jgi:hypothetical protein
MGLLTDAGPWPPPTSPIWSIALLVLCVGILWYTGNK